MLKKQEKLGYGGGKIIFLIFFLFGFLCKEMADFNDDTDQEFNEAEDEANERARNAIQAKPVR